MRIVFGILSSNNTDTAIQQIIDSIGSKHIIIIHHDFNKQPNFKVTGNNVHVLKNYIVTEWAGWSLVEAVIKIIQYAQENITDWQYFQLLSDSCLPIKPISTFENYLNTVQPDANISCIAIAKHQEILLSHGYIAFSSKQTYGHRFLRKINYLSNKIRGGEGHRMIEGLTLPNYTRDNNPVIKFFTHTLQKILFKLAIKGIGFIHPFHGDLECYIGSQFFGCSKQVCQQILLWIDNNAQTVADFKTHIYIPDELFFQTIIGNLHLMHYESTNHLINFFDANTNQGAEFSIDDFERLKNSDKFFARKFSKDPNNITRLNILNEIKK